MFSVYYTVLQNEEQVGKVPLQSIQSPQKIQTIRASQLSVTESKVKWLLHFAFSYV